MQVDIYSAVSVGKNGAGWACMLKMGEHKKILRGYTEQSKNDKTVEFAAILKTFESLKKPCDVDLYCSPFLSANYLLYDKKDKNVKYPKLCQILDKELKKNNVTFKFEESNEYFAECRKIADEELDINEFIEK